MLDLPEQKIKVPKMHNILFSMFVFFHSSRESLQTFQASLFCFFKVQINQVRNGQQLTKKKLHSKLLLLIKARKVLPEK